ncbi:sensor histidine kinase [Rhizohabitans arisaemae]|uniref:sensor histidine kinase n=1 Tax=Rhizohabitans arisaemae TaxID=2720610 RepID=UPI0024B22E86|nr:sensor histidine kinase [Rhizohabitans arisaemae]
MTANGTTHAAAALRGNPLGFVLSVWPLRALAFQLSGIVTGLMTVVWLPVALVCGVVVLTPLLIRPLVEIERRRAAILGDPILPDTHRRPDRQGVAAWLRSRYAEAATWRELAYLVLHGGVLLLSDLLALVAGLTPMLVFLSGVTTFLASEPGTAPAGAAPGPVESGVGVHVTAGAAFAVAATLVLLCYTTTLAALAHREVARLLLSPGDEVRVRTLTRSRARLIDAFEVERRRIERDLHDGAQQRLLRLGMTLVTAQLELDHDPEAAKPLIRQATEEAGAVLVELRELVRGIHPQVLTDLGLPAAVAELADRSPVPVTVDLRVPRRLPPSVESAAYFVVAEALANAAKHARATRVRVTGAATGETLVVEVRDDGRGGADPASGTGLAGLADRVDALDGVLTLTSPRGGPTTLGLELPCSG